MWGARGLFPSGGQYLWLDISVALCPSELWRMVYGRLLSGVTSRTSLGTSEDGGRETHVRSHKQDLLKKRLADEKRWP